MGRAAKFGLIGCGSLVVLVVLVAILAAALGGGTDTADSPVEEGEQPAGEEQPAEEQPAAVGETVEVGDVAWQVMNARQATEITAEFMEPKQGNFVVVDFLFTNNGDEAVTLDSESLALLDGEGREFEVDTDNTMYVDPNKDVFLQQVNPGVTREGEVIFTVAPGASDFTLQVGDTQMFTDENALIDLGF